MCYCTPLLVGGGGWVTYITVWWGCVVYMVYKCTSYKFRVSRGDSAASPCGFSTTLGSPFRVRRCLSEDGVVQYAGRTRIRSVESRKRTLEKDELTRRRPACRGRDGERDRECGLRSHRRRRGAAHELLGSERGRGWGDRSHRYRRPQPSQSEQSLENPRRGQCPNSESTQNNARGHRTRSSTWWGAK